MTSLEQVCVSTSKQKLFKHGPRININIAIIIFSMIVAGDYKLYKYPYIPNSLCENYVKGQDARENLFETFILYIRVIGCKLFEGTNYLKVEIPIVQIS